MNASEILTFSDIPFLVKRSPLYLVSYTPSGDRTYRDVRDEFLLDLACMEGRKLESIAFVIQKMRRNVAAYPDEFTAEATSYVNRLYAAAIAKRLIGELK